MDRHPDDNLLRARIGIFRLHVDRATSPSFIAPGVARLREVGHLVRQAVVVHQSVALADLTQRARGC
jgi:hypothetical protein